MEICCDSVTLEPAQLAAGFEAGPRRELPGRVAPSFARLRVGEGRYRLSVIIAADRDVDEALLFANHRRLLWRGALKAGEKVTVTSLCAVHPYMPENDDEPVKVENIELALVAPGARLESAGVQAVDAPAVLLMGDSTVTDQRTITPYAPGATYAGWGQMLPVYLGESACVINYARSGLTVETFRTEGLYDLLRTQVRPGDIVLIQFGHNDQKRRHLLPDGGYSHALKTYIDELSALGARYAVVTPLARNSWKSEREYLDLLRSFDLAAKRIAQEKGVPVIDLHGFMRELLERTGRDAAKPLFHIGDYTHTNDFGAFAAAGFVAGELARLGLIDWHVAPHEEWVPRGPYDLPAADLGDELLPPSGLDALYAGFETVNPDAPLTRIEAISLVCRMAGLFTMNERVPMPADVPLFESWSDDVQCALQHGLIPNDMLADGKLHRRRAISAEDFMRILTRGYGMRCPVDALPKGLCGPITRAQAAAICREARI